MISTNDLKNGITIEVDGAIFVVLSTEHVKPGKGAAIVKAKLKNLRTGAIFEQTFNAGVKVATARIEKQLMQYLYTMNDVYYFMNMDSYEQLELSKEAVGEDANFLKENLEVYITSYEGEVLGLQLPDKVELVVTHTEPAVKGNTTNNALKDAEVETGMNVRVPLFIEEGETIIVSTSDGKYVSRA
ncbi:MAG: elongation factor P [Mycoplasmatota bacterium]|mgnify:CR=1 FL=1|nr:elongation factor P [Mycoplasmatota bacterium]